MYDLQEAATNITWDYILTKVSEEELWKRYCSNFKAINQPFLSELYDDGNADCRIFYNRNRLFYKDFGYGEAYYGITDYILLKYNCSFMEMVKMVANDFNIQYSPIKSNLRPKTDVLRDSVQKVRSNIQIELQGFNLTDFNYWGQYGISLEFLEREDIISCKTVVLTTSKGQFSYYSSKDFPIYAFKEYDINFKFLGYKIYFPMVQKGSKWINNSSNTAIQGIKSLSGNLELIGLSKARKDCMCYALLDIEAVAPYNESSNLDINGIANLFSKYPKKFINFDNDEQGIRETLKIHEKYGYPYFFIDQYKDLSDYIKYEGLTKAKIMINKKIKEISE